MKLKTTILFASLTLMTMGFAKYCEEAGNMEPHRHAEEIVFILEAKNGWLRYGDDLDHLDKKVILKPGMTLHVPELEWHVFEYGKKGCVEIIFIYGQTENIRPEEILNKE